MKYTEKLSLKLPDNSDIFDISDINGNMEKLDETIGTMAGGIKSVKCTAEEFSALTPDPNTVYYAVDDNGKVTQYLGAAKLTSGSDPAAAVLSADGVSGMVGAASLSYELDVDLMGETWEQGTYYVNNGGSASSSTGIRMSSYLDVSQIANFVSKKFNITASAGNAKMQYSFCFYDDNKNFLESSTALGWKDNGTFSQCGTSAAPAFIRIILNADSDITPGTLSSAYFKVL